jgi:hypothetical protein
MFELAKHVHAKFQPSSFHPDSWLYYPLRLLNIYSVGIFCFIKQCHNIYLLYFIVCCHNHQTQQKPSLSSKLHSHPTNTQTLKLRLTSRDLHTQHIKSK